MTENGGEFKQKIKDLRVVVEKSLDMLKVLEATGEEKDANRALWVVTTIWNGKEYSNIESALRSKGHKSGFERNMEKLGSI